tara:strand:- start:928 stop:1275 length:348 start_codon:yes stop_codon:yes gene_type:complete
MALIDSQTIVEGGLTPTLTTPAEVTNTFTNGGTEFILIENSSGSSITCTVTTRVTTVENPLYGDLTKSNASTTIEAGATAFMGTFSMTAYNGDDSVVSFTLSSISSIKVAILTLG